MSSACSRYCRICSCDFRRTADEARSTPDALPPSGRGGLRVGAHAVADHLRVPAGEARQRVGLVTAAVCEGFAVTVGCVAGRGAAIGVVHHVAALEGLLIARLLEQEVF